MFLDVFLVKIYNICKWKLDESVLSMFKIRSYGKLGVLKFKFVFSIILVK